MTGQNVGYVRVSSLLQNEERQLDGVELDKIFTEKISGKDINRPQLKECMDYLRDGDTLHVHSIDRLARSLKDLKNIVDAMLQKNITVHFHKEDLIFSNDKEDDLKELMFNMLGAFAQFELSMIKARQREGIAIARKKGKKFGRAASLNKDNIDEIKNLYDKKIDIKIIAAQFNVSRTTLYKFLYENNIKKND